MVAMLDRMSAQSEFRWDDLRLFLAAFRTRSLTRSALQLGLNQSTMSRRLSAFEEALGARLFDRTPEGLLPTELAHRLLDAAQRAEAASHDVARLSAGAAALQGEVRIAVAEGLSYYVLAPALPRFMALHPQLSVSFVISTSMADLTRREADLAVRHVRPQRGDLIAKKLLSAPYALFGSPGFAARLGPGPIALADLDFVGWDQSQDNIPEAQWERSNQVRCRTRANSLTTRVALAQAGCGAIELAQAWGRRLPGLVELPTPTLDLNAEVWLVTHSALREVPKVAQTWRFLEVELLRLGTSSPTGTGGDS